MKNPIFAFFALALTAALLGFSGLVGAMAHGAQASQVVAWTR